MSSTYTSLKVTVGARDALQRIALRVAAETGQSRPYPQSVALIALAQLADQNMSKLAEIIKSVKAGEE